MRSLFKIMLCLFLLGNFSPLNAQVIRGKVQAEDETAIAFASLVLWEENGRQMLHFCTADQYGNYELPVKQLSGMLIASSLGFRPDTVVLKSLPESERSRIDFRLAATTFELQSVEVSDSRIPYKVTGDTATYQSEFFADGSEQVIEDLVEKLPGTSVGDDGTIFYKGKQVEKVLLENDELFGRKYTIGTRSLRADVVDEIQFIDHYVENPLLQEVKQSDQLVMNISIKEDRKKLLFGDSSLGAGLPGKYEAGVNLFSLFGNNKAVLVGNAENTAGSPLDMSSLFRDGISLDEPIAYNRAPGFLVRLPTYRPFELEKAEIKNGNIYQGASNLVFNPGEKLKIRSFGLGFKDRWDLDTRSFFRDLNLGNQYEFEDRSAYRERNRGLEWNVEAIWGISDDSNLKYNFNIARHSIAGQAGTMVSSPDRDTLLQLLDNESYTNIHRLNWVKKLNNKQVLVWDGAYIHRRKEQDFNLYDEHQDQAQIEQKNEHIVKDADLLASLLGKNGSLKYALSLKYRLQTDRLEISPTSNDLLSQDPGFEDHFQNDYQQHFLALIGSFSTQIGIAELFSKLELGYRNARLSEDQVSVNTNSAFYPNFRSGFSLRINKKSTFLLSGGVGSETPAADDLITGPAWTSYRSILMGANRIAPYLSCSGMVAFNHSNNAKLLELSASLIYRNNTRAFQDRYFFDGLFAIRNRQLIKGGDLWTLNGSLDKYLPGLFANLGLDLYSSINRSLVLSSEGLPNEVRLRTNAVELSYTTVFKGPFNVGVSGERAWSSYRQLGVGVSSGTKNNRSSLRYFFILKPDARWYFKLITRQIFTNNQGQKAKALLLGTLRTSYQFKNGFRAGINIYNVWNTRVYNLENLSGESYSLQSWVLNPRMLLLNIGFRF